MKKLFPLISLILLIGCTTPKEIIKEVPVEVVRTEYKTEYIHDSIHEHDSTYIYIKGDTVFSTKYQLKYIARYVHDTVITHDTVPVTLTNTIVVTNEVKKAQWWPVWLSLGIIFVYLLVTKTKAVSIIKEFIKYVIKLFK